MCLCEGLLEVLTPHSRISKPEEFLLLVAIERALYSVPKENEEDVLFGCEGP